jgi:hypothetical protein
MDERREYHDRIKRLVEGEDARTALRSLADPATAGPQQGLRQEREGDMENSHGRVGRRKMTMRRELA